jgi:uncharacterized protein YqjF (DUF2071 family)
VTIELLTAPARQASTLEETAHRPWPVPRGPWVMAQTWDDLLFAHWPVAVEELRRLVPSELRVDEHDGSAWLGITPFVISSFRLRGTLPIPWLSTFPELNVRTYVTAEDRPGIWFFSLDTSSPLAVEGARRVYKLPYFHARMSALRHGDRIDYSSSRRDDEQRPYVFRASYEPAGEVSPAAPGSLEAFLTERYCLYSVDDGGLRRAEIHHPPWPLQAAEAEIELNTMAPDHIRLSDEPPQLHYSRRQDVLIWPLEAVGSRA